MRILLILISLVLCTMSAAAAIDTVYLDNGTASSANAPRAGWEESIILSPNSPCKILKVQIYYQGGTGADTVRITGDASEGTIPPTQYCFSYNTLAKVQVNVTGPGWKEIDLEPYNVMLGGYDRVVVQHLMRANGPLWAMDAGQQNIMSYVYDPITPNPNFYNIPGIYYRANGDYLVRLIVDKPYTEQPPPTWTDVTSTMGIVDAAGNRFRSDLASVADVNGDGWDDISIGNILYVNGKGTPFARKALPFSAGNVVWADIDNDGDVDAFAVNGNGGDAFYRNDGDQNADGTIEFTNMTSGSGFDNNAPTVTPLFLDFDHDGDLDLFIANGRKEVGGVETYFQDKLFRHDGNWKFIDITQNSGIASGEPTPFYDTWGASLTDVNNDGWTDIFVATYRLAPDRLYISNKNGTFTESSQATGAIGIPTAAANYYGHGMGSDWADIDNDGDIDLAVGNLGHPDQRGMYSNPSLILRNEGTLASPKFKNWASGLTFREMNAGMCFGDFDHDGKSDLYHGQISYEGYGVGADRPAHFYLQGATRFEDKTWETGLFIHGSWTGVRIDFDHDGDLDLLAASGTHEVRLFRNDLAKNGSSVVIRLVNTTVPTMPRNGEGCLVRVHTSSGAYLRQLPGTVIGGRCSQMTNTLHVGLGSATSIDSIVVIWPNGTKHVHRDVPINRTVDLSSNGTTISSGIAVPQLVAPALHATNVAMRPSLQLALSAPAEYQVSTSRNFSSDVITLSNISSPVTLQQDLQLGRTYFWRARYEVGPTAGPWSSTWQFTVGAPQPNTSTITVPTANDTVSTKTVVSWRRSSYDSWQKPVVYYTVRVLQLADHVQVAEARNLADTTATFNLEPNKSYVVEVMATSDSTIERSWSEEVPFHTYSTAPSMLLESPTNGATSQPVRPRLTWHKHAWVDKGYVVQYDVSNTFATATEKVRPDSVFPIISSLKPGTTYYWRVRGDNEAGEGAWSEVWSFTTSGTSSVEEPGTSIRSGTAERIVVYDLLGRALASGSVQDWEHLRSRLPSLPVLVMTIASNGDVVERFLLPTP